MTFGSARTQRHRRETVIPYNFLFSTLLKSSISRGRRIKLRSDPSHPTRPSDTRTTTMGSKLPEDLKWSEAAATLLAETEKKSVKAVSTTINKACAEKEKKVSAMAAVVDLATWAKEAGAFWPEPYLVALMPNVLALCADKQKDVQVKAEEVTTASASPA